jgi:1-deoxy-D-xylulose-5-phosphate synthase
MVPVALAAAETLRERGIDCGVANARFAKPLDAELLGRICAMAPRILTLEEHLATGGFGSGVLEAFHAAGLPAQRLKIHAIPDQFVEHSPQALQRANLKLDAPGVVAKTLEIFPDLARAARAGADPAAGKLDEKLAETVTW